MFLSFIINALNAAQVINRSRIQGNSKAKHPEWTKIKIRGNEMEKLALNKLDHPTVADVW